MNQQRDEKINGLVFDMDGLIFNTEKIVQRSWEKAGLILGYENFGAHIYNTIGFNVIRREVYFKENVSLDFPMEKFNELTRKYFHEIADTEGVEQKPGVLELLKYAKGIGLKIGLATSTRKAHASILMEEQGLLQYFDGAVYGDMVTEGKPNPEIYRKACQAIGQVPQYVVALEDAPAGIRSATAAGMRVVMIPDLVQPDEEIQNLLWKRFDTLQGVLEILK